MKTSRARNFIPSPHRGFRLRLSAFLTAALLCGTGAVALAGARCEGVQKANPDLILGLRKPTDQEALAIIGDFSARVQLSNALNHVAQVSTADFKTRAETLRSLLIAIADANLNTWSFTQFRTADNGLGFVGPQGYFVAITPDGRLRKGIMDTDRDINDQGLWSGGSEEFRVISVDPDAQ